MTTHSLLHVVRQPAPGANPAATLPPLLILLHGVGSNEQSMAHLASTFDARFVVVSVRAPIALGPNAFCWFHVSFGSQVPLIVAEEAAAGWDLLARFIDEMVEAYRADGSRVYLAGFSQGAIMALATMLTAPERLAGVAVMSGRLLPEVLPHAASPSRLRDKPVLMIHGVADEKLGIHFARMARDELARFPLALTYQELPMGHTVTSDSLARVNAWLAALLDDTLPAHAPAGTGRHRE